MLSDYAAGDAKLLEALFGFAEMRAAIKDPISTARSVTLLTKKLDKLSGGSSALKIDMREMWGSKTIPQIAKKLGRSETAINIKAKRLGLGTFKDSSEYLPALQISKLLGVDIHAITDYWIPKCGLKFKRISPRGKQYFTYIKITDVMEWLWLNPDKWDSRRVELYAFGCEPEWLQAKRKLDLASKPRGCFKWTAQEDAKLVMLYRSGAKIQDIADTLGRTHALGPEEKGRAAAA